MRETETGRLRERRRETEIIQGDCEESLQSPRTIGCFNLSFHWASEISRVAKPQWFGTAVTRNVTHDTTSTRYLVRQAPYNNASGTNRWIRWYRSPYLTRATLPAGRDTFPARVTSNCPCHILTDFGPWRVLSPLQYLLYLRSCQCLKNIFTGMDSSLIKYQTTITVKSNI